MIHLLFLLACSSDPTPVTATGQAVDPLDGGWIDQLSSHPDAFARLISDGHRPGWIALHAGDWAAASQNLTGHALRRALTEEAAVDRDLARVASFAWPHAWAAWATHNPPESGANIALGAAIAALDAGDDEAGRAYADVAAAHGEPAVAAFAADIAATWPPATAGEGMPCLSAQLSARAAPLDADLSPCADHAPMLSLVDGDVHKDVYDPAIYGTRAIVNTANAEALPESSDWAERLVFSGHWSSADRTAALKGEFGPGRTALGMGAPLSGPDDPEAARSEVRALDAALDAWSSDRIDRASPEGRELMVNLRLIGVYRSRLLLQRAREALLADQPRAAEAYVQLALDLEHGRTVGPLNPPGLFAVLAEARLRSGHSREALDALQPLLAARPDVRGLDETIGDLVILEGIGRQGDSKEH